MVVLPSRLGKLDEGLHFNCSCVHINSFSKNSTIQQQFPSSFPAVQDKQTKKVLFYLVVTTQGVEPSS